MNNEGIKKELTSFSRDLFVRSEFQAWTKNLLSYKAGRWHSLIVELDKYEAPLNSIKQFDEGIHSRIVFHCMKAPNFKTSKEIMVTFTVSGWLWSSVIWHTNSNFK